MCVSSRGDARRGVPQREGCAAHLNGCSGSKLEPAIRDASLLCRSSRCEGSVQHAQAQHRSGCSVAPSSAQVEHCDHAACLQHEHCQQQQSRTDTPHTMTCQSCCITLTA